MRRVLQSAHGSVPWREPQAALELTLAHLRRSAMAAALLALIVAAALSGGLSTGHSVVASRTRPRVAHGGLAGLSAPARDALLQKLGASDPAYRIEASAGGYRAVNPSQGLRLGFSRSGVLVGAGALRLRLSVRALGYGSSLRALGEGPAPQVKADRVRYTRGGLSEWYVNGPLGLEQGFTIARAPAGVADGPLTLSIALSGNAQATLASDRQSLTLASSGAPRLRYGDLLARDANGRVLHSWLALGATGVLLRVDARDARYPLTLDPLVQQGQKLTGAGEAGAGQFGYSVALSADGNTALIGAPADNANAGAAWVFTRSGSGWTQQGEKLTGGGETGEGGFGSSVALSADGGTALVGGPADDSRAGAAWVFTRSGSGWTQQGEKLTGGEEISFCCGGDFGHSVALSADGNTALIGGFDDNSGAGAAWVFTRSGSGWTQQGAKLTPRAGEEIEGAGGFGSSVALSEDGNTALIGGATAGFEGAAWVFTRSRSTWTQQGERLAAAAEEDSQDFGESVALSADGNTALIGGVNGTYGAAWVFTRSGSSWAQQGPRLTGEGPHGSEHFEEVGTGHFGWSVALSADGNTALIGAFSDKHQVPAGGGANPPVGTVWLFARLGSSWIQAEPRLFAEREEVGEGAFGQSVALSADAGTALIGGPGDSGGLGAAWVLGPPAPASAPAPAPLVTPAVVPTPPVLTKVSQSRADWREGKALAVLARTAKLAPIGTTFSFTLDQPATVSFSFTQQVDGRRVSGKCVAQTKQNRDKPACRRTVTQGKLSLAAVTGANRLSFQGLITHSQKLAPGTYTLVLTATNSAKQQSQPHSLTFTIAS